MISTIVATAFYTTAWASLLTTIRRKTTPSPLLTALLIAGIAVHAFSVYESVFSPHSIHLGFFQVASVLFLMMNIIVTISTQRLPLHNVFLLLLPLSVAALFCALLTGAPSGLSSNLTLPLVTHILLSIIAYSLLMIATLQALLLAYQNSRLKSHHVKSLMGVFPPLQTMERLLFDFVWAGFILLTLSIGTGIIFIENMLAQQLSHKLVFSLASWMIYAVLLGGRHAIGWRGNAAIRWVLAGFLMLMIAYFGSKFVLEFLLTTTT